MNFFSTDCSKSFLKFLLTCGLFLRGMAGPLFAQNSLSLSFTPNSIPEHTGLTSGTLTRAATDVSAALTVTITVPSTRATAATSVLIPAGQTSVRFPVTAVDDATTNGSETFSITAAAAGFTNGIGNLTVTDDEGSSQIYTVDKLADEADGNTTAGNMSFREAVAAACTFSGKGIVRFSTAGGSPFIGLTPAKITLTLAELTINGDIVIEGPTVGVIVDAGDTFRAVNISDSNAATSLGVFIQRVQFMRGRAPTAPGVVNAESLRMVDCSISNCTATAGNAIGGGLSNTGTARLTHCSITGNALPTGNNSQGGGINNTGALVLHNSTVSDNNSGAVSQGGGLRNTNLAVLTHVTLAGNRLVNSSSTGTGINNAGTLYLANTIVSGNTGGATVDLYGEFIGEGVNLVRTQGNGTALGSGVVLTSDPLLSVVANHGGKHLTCKLGVGSPALNAGSNAIATAAGLTTDQRGTGYIRQFGTNVDLGAYEENGQTLTVTFSPTSVFEANATTGTVTRAGGSNAASLTVLLTSLDTTEATVPASVVIPAGQSSANFTVTTLNDSIQDNAQTAMIQAEASGYLTSVGSFTVLDIEKFMVVTINAASIQENGGVLNGSATGTVTRYPFSVGAITINLASFDTTGATVPATVVMPDGASSVTFPITAVDDVVIDATQTVTITANTAGYLGGSSTIDVINDDIAQTFVVDFNSDIDNGNTTAGNVTLREAIRLANAAPVQPTLITYSTAVGSPFAGPNRATTIISSAGATISSHVIIRAPDHGVLLDGQNAFRLLTIAAGKYVRLENLSLTKGRVNAGGATGGGILNNGFLTLANCTMSANNALGGGATGGAISQQGGTLTVFNSTFANNVSTSNGASGAIQVSGGRTRLVHCTVAGNTPDAISSTAELTVVNCLFDNNNGKSLTGAYLLEGSSLIRGLSGTPSGSGSFITTDPLLGALADNGGPTQTLLPGAGSAAINAGSSAAATGLTTDQRLLPRLSGSAVDIGAVEIQTITIPYTTWASTNFPGGTSVPEQDFNFDLDKDGLVNGLEYYFGTNPATPDPNPFTLSYVPGTNTLNVSFPHLIGTSLTLAQLEWSTNLISWNTTNFTYGAPSSLPDGREQIHAAVSESGATKLFVRLRITP
jgi:hypothetical protein